jgi:hypothetical protein
MHSYKSFKRGSESLRHRVPTTATIPLRRKNFCPVADQLEKIKAVSRRPSCPAVITNASLSVRRRKIACGTATSGRRPRLIARLRYSASVTTSWLLGRDNRNGRHAARVQFRTLQLLLILRKCSHGIANRAMLHRAWQFGNLTCVSISEGPAADHGAGEACQARFRPVRSGASAALPAAAAHQIHGRRLSSLVTS